MGGAGTAAGQLGGDGDGYKRRCTVHPPLRVDTYSRAPAGPGPSPPVSFPRPPSSVQHCLAHPPAPNILPRTAATLQTHRFFPRSAPLVAASLCTLLFSSLPYCLSHHMHCFTICLCCTKACGQTSCEPELHPCHRCTQALSSNAPASLVAPGFSLRQRA